MPSIVLTVAGSGEVLTVAATALIICGYTGRDVEAVQAHIRELVAIGVRPPQTVPSFYLLNPDLLTTDDEVNPSGSETSGEVEPVLLRADGSWYLGVGSDHTDRRIERSDVAQAKAVCPKPISRTVVRLQNGLSVDWWDDAVVTCWSDDSVYQSGRLEALRRPADLYGLLMAEVGQVEGDVAIFAGTLPLMQGEFVMASKWTLELRVPDGEILRHSYRTTDMSR